MVDCSLDRDEYGNCDFMEDVNIENGLLLTFEGNEKDSIISDHHESIHLQLR